MVAKTKVTKKQCNKKHISLRPIRVVDYLVVHTNASDNDNQINNLK